MMDRRAFVAGAAAAFAATPRVVWAQDKRRIAMVHVSRPVEQLSKAGGVGMYIAFLEELEERGYSEGQNLVIDRWTGRGGADRDELARRIVASGPEVIFVSSGAPLGPNIVKATSSIPIVFYGQDPVRFGLVSNLAHPGKNVTGISGLGGSELSDKRLQYLVEAVQTAGRVAYLGPNWAWDINGPNLREAASVLGISLIPVLIEQPFDETVYRQAFSIMAAERVDALLVGGAGENSSNRKLIAQLSLEARIPAIYTDEFAKFGGLMAYGPDYSDGFRRAARYVARILEGEHPGDLPVQQPTVFNFEVNLKTAEALGITIPPLIMIQATELIE